MKGQHNIFPDTWILLTMARTYTDNHHMYSVDMMFAYINNHDNKKIELKVSDLIEQLEYRCWWDPIQRVTYSPSMVMNNPEKYPAEMKKIQNADLSYPIIVSWDGNIVDGMHRLSKVFLENRTHINAYVFDEKLMQKFIIGNKGEWDRVNKMQTYEFIDLYVRRFC